MHRCIRFSGGQSKHALVNRLVDNVGEKNVKFA
jgi:hypothetical protein